MQSILVNGEWRAAHSVGSFSAFDPTTGRALPEQYPISSWPDCDAMLEAASAAFGALRKLEPERIAVFLETYAARLDAAADDICAIASRETGLPIKPRLKEVELVRTTNQLRQAAGAARDGSWSMPTIDTANQLRSYFSPVGPVIVLGPNNFPLAFNGMSGGDFATALAAGNPVIAKGHPSHPQTTEALGHLVTLALRETGLPPATCQMLYQIPPDVGLRWVADPRVGALGFTGSKAAGLALKSACDAVGKPAYLEMSSNNPVVILPGALHERRSEIADQLVASCTAAAGQMCTSPGLVFAAKSSDLDAFSGQVARRFKESTPGTLLSPNVLDSLEKSVSQVVGWGAKLITGGHRVPGDRLAFENTLLRIDGDPFSKRVEAFQTEMFGTATLLVVVDNPKDIAELIRQLHGNLTGAIYASHNGADDELYAAVSTVLRPKVGRMMNDKMPTGVVVSPAMQHGGPFPATGHAGFTSVGIPAALRRFASLQCFDHVPDSRLPPALRNKNPNGKMLRFIDGLWTTDDV